MGNSALLKSIEEALLREGLSVHSAGNGIDAVMEAFSQRPRCVLLGQVMAGVDGIKACRLIRSLIPENEMPVVVSIPDSKPEMRRRALQAGAASVVEYSTTVQRIAELVRKLISKSVTSSTPVELPLSRGSILAMAADSIEEALEITETVVYLADELRGVSSVTEACRKTSAAVLRGLGFQRVWIGMLSSDSDTLKPVYYKGRGVAGDPLVISGVSGKLPADIAISTGKQVLSWQLDKGQAGLEWAGSMSYIDTPFFSGTDTAGLIRCDNGLSKRLPDSGQIRALSMVAGILSSFVRYMTVQGILDEKALNVGRILHHLRVLSLTADGKGRIREISGENWISPFIQETVAEESVYSFFSSFSEDLAEEFERTVLKGGLELTRKPVRIGDSSMYAGISCMPSSDGSISVMISDRSAEARLAERVQSMEFETDAMASLAADLTSEMDAGEICRIISRTVEKFYPEETAAVLAPESLKTSFEPDSMIVYAVSGARNRASSLLPRATVLLNGERDSGVLGEAVRKARVTNIPDLLNSDYYFSGSTGSRSELVIPMMSRGRIVGVVDILSPVQNRFQADDIRRLNNITGFAAGVLESALQQTELIRVARRDRLTGLHNMTFFEERYPEEFERALRYQYSFSLIMMDIDDFKTYNDTYGHPMGNVLLQKVTQAMIGSLREVDILVRYGGEEFICVLPLTDKQVAVEIAERVRRNVLEANSDIPNASSQPGGCVSLSLGVAAFPEDSREQAELVEIADRRMYRAKREGKNRTCHT